VTGTGSEDPGPLGVYRLSADVIALIVPVKEASAKSFISLLVKERGTPFCG
jgi:hypothetical protein